LALEGGMPTGSRKLARAAAPRRPGGEAPLAIRSGRVLRGASPCAHLCSAAAISSSFATVFQLRSVPPFSFPSITGSLESDIRRRYNW